jgi:hypothetical protein
VLIRPPFIQKDVLLFDCEISREPFLHRRAEYRATSALCERPASREDTKRAESVSLTKRTQKVDQKLSEFARRDGMLNALEQGDILVPEG